MSVYKENDDYLRKSIQSVISQSFKDFELILIDDGMTEGNIEVVRSFSDPRIKLVKNEVNLGLTRSLVKAVEISEGTYVARLDSDDYMTSSRLDEQVRFLNENNDYVLCGSKTREIGLQGERDPIVPFKEEDKEIRKALVSFNPFAHSALMFRRDAYTKVGGYSPKFDCAQDYDLIVKIAELGKLKNLPSTLVYRHVGHENISAKKNKRQVYLSIRARLHAMKTMGVSISSLYYFMKSIIVLILPIFLVKLVREIKS